MREATMYWLRKLQRLAHLPGKIPGSLYYDAAELGMITGEALAEHQHVSGFLGQYGSFGGGVWLPDSVDMEYEFIRGSRMF